MGKFWGSRADKKTSKLADQFSFSIEYDNDLALYDCVVGIAHAKMLGECKIIPKTDAKKIISGLNSILKQINKGTFKINYKEEDIHSHIQTVLKKRIGNAADKLHTARSRNDLVATDIKLYCNNEAFNMAMLLFDLYLEISEFSKKNLDVIIPAYTHLQSAQLVLLSHHVLAYQEMISRDITKIGNYLDNHNASPLGSCALSGTSLPIDRKKTTHFLNFDETTSNSMDAVSDRDCVIDLLYVTAMMGMHFSRMAEDLIIWSSSEFNYIDIDWSLCTGSSIMPHKKNPDILELIRGETSTFTGNLNKLLVLMKGLPLTYNRDMQLDKPPLFESVGTIKEIIPLMTSLFKTLKVNKDVIKKRIEGDESFYSVDIMEYLIKKGVPYREAHDSVGKIYKKCFDKNIKIEDLSLKELQKFHPKLDLAVKKLLNPEMSVKIKKSYGSTNPTMVKREIQKRLKK